MTGAVGGDAYGAGGSGPAGGPGPVGAPAQAGPFGAGDDAWTSQVEARLLQLAVADSPFVTDAAQHLLVAGGKRLRPQLVRLAAQFATDVDEERLVRAAAVVELTHVASLYHDDVIDEATLRRGVDSANAHYGNSVAILTGDFLFARASSVVATLGQAFVARQAETFARMVQGQIAELKGAGDGVDPMAHYLSVLADKTAALIATSAVFGGMVAGLDPALCGALDRFGEALGMAFQLSDDLLDITSDTIGKLAGTDLRQGVATLPLLLLQRSADADDRALAASLQPGMTDAAVRTAVAALRGHPVLALARGVIDGYADQARTECTFLPAGPGRDALSALVDEVTNRVSAA